MLAGRRIQSEVFLRDDIENILRGLALANANESPDFYRALAAVALSFGLRDIAHRLNQFGFIVLEEASTVAEAELAQLRGGHDG